MKRAFLLFPLSLAILACTINVTSIRRVTLTQTAISNISYSPKSTITPTPTIVSTQPDEAAIRNLIANFGKKLRSVSLLASDAAQEVKVAYSEFVSPALLEKWMNDLLHAPGRMVSSPWPDRIEITGLTKESDDKYVITGEIIELTSVEVVNGGAAAKIPVQIVVQREADHWLITDYVEEQ